MVNVMVKEIIGQVKRAYVVVLGSLVQDAGWQGILERWPCHGLQQAVSEEAPDSCGIVASRPAAVRGIEHDAIQPRDAHISEVLVLQALGVAQGLVDQATGESVDAAQVAQVDLQT